MTNESQKIAEYASAIYEIYDPRIILRVGEVSKELDALLDLHGDTAWAFITPFNPDPVRLSDAENNRRPDELRDMCTSYVTCLGEGRDPEWEVPGERGLYILGITVDEATDIGHYFKQKAILTGNAGSSPELCVLR